jgi:asparagine synthase (glutamine-hydrolysing)
MPYWYRGVPLDPEFVRRASLLERYEGEYQALERQPRDPRRAHRDVLTSPRIPLGLSIADRLAALHGVEPRYPFLDSRFAELCLAVPAEQKLRGGYNRDLMRRALDDLLPAKVRYRGSKARPGAHIAHTLPTKGRKLMDDVILRNPDPIADYVKIDRVREQYSRCLAGANSNEWFPVWRVVVGSLWLANARARYRLES